MIQLMDWSLSLCLCFYFWPLYRCIGGGGCGGVM
jgi:hypothetical protein